MPVTFAPATATAAHDTPPATSRDVAPVTAAHLLSAANVDHAKARIVRSSIGGRPGPDNTQFKIAPAPGNGFVDTVLCAYTHRHALVIRPDDVWLALVAQFSFYATAAGRFLDTPSAALALEISVDSDAAQPDVARLSRRITRLLQKTVPDADLRDWLLPEFSTTTLVDTTVSCLLVLSASSSSSSASPPPTHSDTDSDDTFPASAGIPRVTLEGERADWDLLLARLDRLKTRSSDFGLPALAWSHLLHPVLSHFVAAFDAPDGAENRAFWGAVVVAQDAPNGSKDEGKLSGWLAAFCAFSAEGAWLGPELVLDATPTSAPATLTAAQFWATYTLSSSSTSTPAPAPAPAPPKPKPKSKAAKAKAKKSVQLDLLDASPVEPPAPTVVIARADVPRAYASAGLCLALKVKSKSKVNGVSCGVNGAGVNGTATKVNGANGTTVNGTATKAC
ncbi:hypothetical protein C8R44DRAFT_692534, partial [Mycena epipterygia]